MWQELWNEQMKFITTILKKQLLHRELVWWDQSKTYLPGIIFQPRLKWNHACFLNSRGTQDIAVDGDDNTQRKIFKTQITQLLGSIAKTWRGEWKESFIISTSCNFLKDNTYWSMTKTLAKWWDERITMKTLQLWFKLQKGLDRNWDRLSSFGGPFENSCQMKSVPQALFAVVPVWFFTDHASNMMALSFKPLSQCRRINKVVTQL